MLKYLVTFVAGGCMGWLTATLMIGAHLADENENRSHRHED